MMPRVTLPAQIGRYRILGELGRGNMGTVYRGRDEALERDVAVKVMRFQDDEDARSRFQKEGRAAARLQHPNIVTIYELGEHEGSPFMVLELLEGMDLQQAIEAGIRPDPKVTLPIVLQALAGLGHAHEAGIVHRDVKPSNIFLPRGRPAKIMDFGVARLADKQTTKNMLVGTPNYMSPEQARAGSLDGRSDLFSVGLILYELVTGEKAYRGETIVAVIFKITNEAPDLGLFPRGAQWERLRAIVTRALQRKPDDRYPDARSMSADLLDALRELGGTGDWMTPSDQGLLARPPKRPGLGTPTPSPSPLAAPIPVVPPTPGTAAPAAAPSSRTPMALAAALGVGALGLLGLALFLVVRPGSPRPSPAPPRRRRLPPRPPCPRRARPFSPAPSPPATAAAIPRTPAASASPSAASVVVSAAEARLDRANDHMEKRRYAQALAEAKGVLEREPDNVAARSWPRTRRPPSSSRRRSGRRDSPSRPATPTGRSWRSAAVWP